MNPGNPSPMMTPPPPPPPAKGGFPWKWVLIGCGGVTLLGVLACAGCLGFIYMAAKKAINEGMAQVKPLVENNEVVKSKVGKIDTMDPDFSSFSAQQHGTASDLHFSIKVVGDKGKGTLQVKMRTYRDDKEQVVSTLKFRDEAGNVTPIGVWRGRGNNWTPLTKEPDDE